MLLFFNNKWICRIYLRRCNCYFQNWQRKNLDIWLVLIWWLKWAVTQPAISWNETQDISPALLSHLLLYPPQNHPIAQWHHQEITSSETRSFISAPPLSSLLPEVSMPHQFPFGPWACTTFSLDITPCFLISMQLRETFRKKGRWYDKTQNLGYFAFFVLLLGKAICCRSEEALY